MKRILLVDDNELDRACLSIPLQNQDIYELYEAEDGVEALKVIEKYKLDLIISDIAMPEMDGKELLQQVIKLNIDIPFLVVSRIDDINTAVSMIKNGAIEYITKPINSDEVLFKIEKAFQDFENKKKLLQLQVERQIREERQHMFIDWKSLYGHSDKSSIHTMVKMLLTYYGHAGGAFLGQMIKNSLVENDEGSYILPKDLVEILIKVVESQEKVINTLSSLSNLYEKKLDIKRYSLKYFSNHIKQLPDKSEKLLTIKNHSLNVFTPDEQFSNYVIDIDLSILDEVIEELVINSMKYSNPSDNIQLYIWINKECQSKGCIVISILNPAYPVQGRQEIVGVPHAYSEQVFEIFYRMTNTPIEIYEEKWSSGVGLFFVREMIKKMSGMVEIGNVTNHLDPKQIQVSVELSIPIEWTPEEFVDENVDDSESNAMELF
jgi:DNA-binding response OmpR family regulator